MTPFFQNLYIIKLTYSYLSEREVKWLVYWMTRFKLKLAIQSVVSAIAFTLDIYGCYNFGLPPAVLSVSVGVFDMITLLWLWKNGDK